MRNLPSFRHSYSICLFIIQLIYISGVYAQCNSEKFTGEGTYYQYNGGGNCGFPSQYYPLYSAALNGVQYKQADLCGACAEVTGPKGKMVVSIEDQCPECLFGDLDLEIDAFPFIAQLIDGRVPITWQIISCPLQGPIKFYLNENSNPYWTSIQIRNHINPILKFEYQAQSGFVELIRKTYNFYELSSGLGSATSNFRITDIFGNIILEENITLVAGSSSAGKGQFPTCSPIDKIKDNTLDFFVLPSALNGKTLFTNTGAETIYFKVYTIEGKILENGFVDKYSTYTPQINHAGFYLIKAYTINNVYISKFFIPVNN